MKEIRTEKSRDHLGDWRYKIRGAPGHKQSRRKKLDKSQDSNRTGADKLKIWYTNADSLLNKRVEFLQILSQQHNKLVIIAISAVTIRLFQTRFDTSAKKSRFDFDFPCKKNLM